MQAVWFTHGQRAAFVAGERIDCSLRVDAVIQESQSSIPPAVAPVAGSLQLQPRHRRATAA